MSENKQKDGTDLFESGECDKSGCTNESTVLLSNGVFTSERCDEHDCSDKDHIRLVERRSGKA